MTISFIILTIETIIYRYLHQDEIHEDFIQFVDLYEQIEKLESDQNDDDGNKGNGNENSQEKAQEKLVKRKEMKATGLKLGQCVVHIIEKLRLDPRYCVAITTDGASVLTSETCGAVKEIRKVAINAAYSPCHCHILNNSLSQTSKVTLVRNSVGTMKETISFLGASAKCSFALKKIMGTQLSGLCETRWIERHDGVLQFRVLLPKIIEVLDHIASWDDCKTASNAKILRSALCDGGFIVAVISLSDILQCTHGLSRFLQKIQIDLKTARNMLDDTIGILKKKREECNEQFSLLFTEITKLANELDVDIKIPRIIGRQNNRANYPTTNPEDYYRQSVYINILDHLMSDLNARFSAETLDLFALSVLFPDSVTLNDDNLMKDASRKISERYAEFFNNSIEIVEKMLMCELELWKIKWKREKYDSSFGALQLLKHCDKDIYPIVNTLLRILATLPLSGASAERTFSALKRIKTWLRNTTGEERLNGLALLHVHYEIELSIDRIIDRYAKSRSHRLEFTL